MMRRSTSLTAVVVLAIVVVGFRVSAATWVSPSLPQSGGNVAPSLNTSASAQVKEGAIVVEGAAVTVTGSPALTIGTSDGERTEFCLGGIDASHCLSGWDDFATLTGKVRLSPSGADAGFANVRAPSTDFADAYEVNGSIRGIAGTPTSTLSTVGVYGEASSESGTSYGIYAENRGGIVSHSAVYADAYLPEVGGGAYGGWAGYFNGSAVISNVDGGTCSGSGTACDSDEDCGGDACTPFPSLLIGDAALPSSSLLKDRGYICLGTGASRCRSTWPTVNGSGYWNVASGTVRPNTAQQSRSLALAGSGSTAGMTVTVSSDAVGTPVGADVRVNGVATFSNYVVGVAPDGEPVTMTCGNRLCEGLENDTFGSPYYCPADCDHTAPGNVEVLFLLAERCNGFNCSIMTMPTFNLYWENPSDPDYAGVKVVISNSYDHWPETYTDESYGDILGGTYPSTVNSIVTTCRTNGAVYFVGLFAFDAVGNYASGTLTTVRCTTDKVYPDYKFIDLGGLE